MTLVLLWLESQMVENKLTPSIRTCYGLGTNCPLLDSFRQLMKFSRRVEQDRTAIFANGLIYREKGYQRGALGAPINLNL